MRTPPLRVAATAVATVVSAFSRVIIVAVVAIVLVASSVRPPLVFNSVDTRWRSTFSNSRSTTTALLPPLAPSASANGGTRSRRLAGVNSSVAFEGDLACSNSDTGEKNGKHQWALKNRSADQLRLMALFGYSGGYYCCYIYGRRCCQRAANLDFRAFVRSVCRHRLQRPHWLYCCCRTQQRQRYTYGQYTMPVIEVIGLVKSIIIKAAV